MKRLLTTPALRLIMASSALMLLLSACRIDVAPPLAEDAAAADTTAEAPTDANATSQQDAADPGTTDETPADPGTTDAGTADETPADPGTTDTGTTDETPTDAGTTDETPADPGTTDTPLSPASASTDLLLPAHAAFLYPWFPNAWSQRGIDPATHFTPELGSYDSSASQTTAQQLAWAHDAGIDAFISSWWGQGHHTDRALDAKMTAAADDTMKWAVYHEQEGQRDPTVSELVADLRYLEDRYFDRPNYAHVDGAPVVFVYNAEGNSGHQDVLDRWAEAEARFGKPVYVNLKVYSGFRDATPQPDSWHQYGPASRFGVHEPYAAYASPGFHHFASSGARLQRDPQAFADAMRKVEAADVDWKLIQTWNEWGEGTSVEPASEWDSTYVDILRDSIADTTTPAPTPPSDPWPTPPSDPIPTPTDDPTPTPTDDPTPTEPSDPVPSEPFNPLPAEPSDPVPSEPFNPLPSLPSGDVTFGLAGDIGGKNDRAGVVLPAAQADGAEWMTALGDMSYSEITPESAWCDWVRSKFSNPMQIVAGNHEADGGPDGDILKFANCMPDRKNSTMGPGGYAVNYYFDDGPVRTILISADLSVGGTSYKFGSGSAERQWLVDAIRSAPGWVVVGMHKVCLTMGNKSCEIGDGLVDLLHAEGVDLVAHGHDHDYQRTHALSCSDPESFRSDCIGDDGADGRYLRDAGTVHVIVGTVGRSLTTCNHDDREAGYFAAHFCGEEGGSAKGYVLVRATGDQLAVTYRNVIGPSFTDRFVIE